MKTVQERIFVKCPGCLKTGWINNIKRENLPKPCPNGTIMKTCNECLLEEPREHNYGTEFNFSGWNKMHDKKNRINSY